MSIRTILKNKLTSLSRQMEGEIEIVEVKENVFGHSSDRRLSDFGENGVTKFIERGGTGAGDTVTDQ